MIKLDILVHPSCSEPNVQQIQEKKSTIKKWKWPWRINMLAAPKPPTSAKYEPPPPEVFKVFGPLDPATEFRSDHLARPMLRTLVSNKIAFNEMGPKYVTTVTKNILKSWDSIYNYYRKRLRDRKLKRLQRKMEKLKAKKPTGKELEKIESMKVEHLNKIAMPKKVFLPPEIPRQHKPLEELAANLEVLAAPKEYHIVPPREIGVVNPAALLYEVTETIKKLAELPKRKRRRLSKDLPPGYVKPSALIAKCSSRMEKLAQPSLSAREAKKQDEDKYDPWAISPTALKYKPSARILELAKPLERK